MTESNLTNSNFVIRYPVKVEWTELGEGNSGDYNPEDPTDEELLRFDISVWNCDAEGEWDRWKDVEDASYCTQFPVKATDEAKKQALVYLMDEVWEELVEGHSIKKLCERLSWIGPLTVAEYLWKRLGDIPISGNEDGIQLDFLYFDAGVPREDIWHWFEDTFDVCVHDLMFPEGVSDD